MKKLMFAAAMAAAMTASADYTTFTFNTSALVDGSYQSTTLKSGRVYMVYADDVSKNSGDANRLTSLMQYVANNVTSAGDINSVVEGAEGFGRANVIGMTYIDGDGNIDLATLKGCVDGKTYERVNINSTSHNGGWFLVALALQGETKKLAIFNNNFVTSSSSLITIENGIKKIDTNVVYTSTNISEVPEPTSALLMLLGMAGLALKRKVA